MTKNEYNQNTIEYGEALNIVLGEGAKETAKAVQERQRDALKTLFGKKVITGRHNPETGIDDFYKNNYTERARETHSPRDITAQLKTNQ